jgi:hypothetical protein
MQNKIFVDDRSINYFQSSLFTMLLYGPAGHAKRQIQLTGYNHPGEFYGRENSTKSHWFKDMTENYQQFLSYRMNYDSYKIVTQNFFFSTRTWTRSAAIRRAFRLRQHYSTLPRQYWRTRGKFILCVIFNYRVINADIRSKLGSYDIGGFTGGNDFHEKYTR